MASDPHNEYLALTPQEIALLRKQIHDVVKDNIEYAREVLSGHSTWTNNQVRVFTSLMSKVVPDLHHSYAQVDIENKSINELTRHELEQIAKAGKIIEVEYKDVTERPDDHTKMIPVETIIEKHTK